MVLFRYHGLAWGLLLLSYWSRAQCQSSEWAAAPAGVPHPMQVLMFDRQMQVAAAHHTFGRLISDSDGICFRKRCNDRMHNTLARALHHFDICCRQELS